MTRPAKIAVVAHPNAATLAIRSCVMSVWGYRVLKAQSADEALTHILDAYQGPIDVLFADVMTHGLSSLEKVLWSDPRLDVRVVRVADQSMSELRELVNRAARRKRGPKKACKQFKEAA